MTNHKINDAGIRKLRLAGLVAGTMATLGLLAPAAIALPLQLNDER